MDAIQRLAQLLLQLFGLVTARALTEGQRRLLEADLPRDAVKTREQAGQKLSYIDGHFAISRANEVFGPEGWSYRTEAISEVHRGTRPGRDGENTVLIYEAIVTVRALGVERTDVGIGQCDAGLKALAQGIEKARKEAVTDALKRALRTFGPSFGLALYDKTQRDVGLSTAALALLDAVKVATDVDAWTAAHRAELTALDPDERAELRAAMDVRREQLTAAPPELPKPAALSAPTNTPIDGHLKRIAVASSLDELAALAVALPELPVVASSEAHRKAIWRSLCTRAQALGESTEAFTTRGAAAKKAGNGTAWTAVATFLRQIDESTTQADLAAVSKSAGKDYDNLPRALKDVVAAAHRARKNAITPVFDQLITAAGRATSEKELQAVHDRLAAAAKRSELTQDQATAVEESLGERAGGLGIGVEAAA